MPDRERDPECLFCRIVAGEIPSRTAAEDELVLAFHDIAPRSPTHVLVIPKVHIPSAADLTDDDGPLLGRMFSTLARIAREAGIAEEGYRIVSNVGAWAGQSVDHLHLHLMGGRTFTWPPG
jgi:histidine triad (HIT) family protein